MVRIALVLALLVGATVALLALRARQGWSIPDWERAEHACFAGRVAEMCQEAGSQYEDGSGPLPGGARALALYERGCALGSRNACTSWYSLRLSRAEDEEERRRAGAQLQAECVEHQHAFACMRYGAHAVAGELGAGRGPQSALRAWALACELEEDYACDDAGRMLVQHGEAVHVAEAMRTALRRCAGGKTGACRLRADAFACGWGVRVDRAAAVRSYLQACRAGDTPACEIGASHLAALDEDGPRDLGTDLEPLSLIRAVGSVARGDSASAAELAESLGEAERAWIAAGLAFDAGDHAAARAHLARVRALRTDLPEPEIFERAIAAAEAGDSLVQAMFEGWLAAGSPVLSHRSLAAPTWTILDPMHCTAHHSVRLEPASVRGDPVFLTRAAGQDGVPPELLDEAARVPDDAPVPDRLGALAALGYFSNAEPLRAEWVQARERLAGSFRVDDSAFAQLVVLGARPAEEPLSSEELALVCGLKAWEPPREALRAEIRRRAERLPKEAWWAREDELSVMVDLVGIADVFRLQKRIEATWPGLDAPARACVLESLLRLADDLEGSPWLLERMLGMSHVRAAAGLTGDTGLSALYAKRMKENRALLGAFQDLYKLGTYPSRRIREATAAEIEGSEVHFARELLRRAGR